MTAKQHVLANMLATKQLQYDIIYLYMNHIYIYVVVTLYIYTHGDVNMFLSKCVHARVCV